jgi:hypothetical protein
MLLCVCTPYGAQNPTTWNGPLNGVSISDSTSDGSLHGLEVDRHIYGRDSCTSWNIRMGSAIVRWYWWPPLRGSEAETLDIGHSDKRPMKNIPCLYGETAVQLVSSKACHVCLRNRFMVAYIHGTTSLTALLGTSWPNLSREIKKKIP